MNNLIDFSILKNVQVKYVKDFDFSEHSTIGVGGKVPYAFYPSSINELIKLIDFLEKEKIPFIVLGRMSNVLPPDGEYRKVVILTTKLTGIQLKETVFCEAGVTVGRFLQTCVKESKTGGEFLAGIPCTIGGAIYMNAGISGKYISDIVEKVLAYRQGKLCILPKNACGFEYKKSIFMEENFVILGVELNLENGESESIQKMIDSVLQSRKRLPKGKSMGCVFKNPIGDSAGRLIEETGLKGLRIGGAIVSTVHANFIINDQNATSNDVKQLITIIKNAVFAQYKIVLKEEIQIID